MRSLAGQHLDANGLIVDLLGQPALLSWPSTAGHCSYSGNARLWCMPQKSTSASSLSLIIRLIKSDRALQPRSRRRNAPDRCRCCRLRQRNPASKLLKGGHYFLWEGKGSALRVGILPLVLYLLSPSGCVISGGPEEGIGDLSSALRMSFRSICPPMGGSHRCRTVAVNVGAAMVAHCSEQLKFMTMLLSQSRIEPLEDQKSYRRTS